LTTIVNHVSHFVNVESSGKTHQRCCGPGIMELIPQSRCYLSPLAVHIPHTGLSVRTGVGVYIRKVGGQESSSLKKYRQIFYRHLGHPPRSENFKIWRQLWWNFRYIPIIKMMFDVTLCIKNK
jgi:hypothetical protein